MRVVVVLSLSLRQVRTCDDIDHSTNIALVPACCGWYKYKAHHNNSLLLSFKSDYKKRALLCIRFLHNNETEVWLKSYSEIFMTKKGRISLRALGVYLSNQMLTIHLALVLLLTNDRPTTGWKIWMKRTSASRMKDRSHLVLFNALKDILL